MEPDPRLLLIPEEDPFEEEYRELFARIVHPRKKALLMAYRQSGIVAYAAQMAGVSRRLHYYWMESDPIYAAASRYAEVEAKELLEYEARRRATDKIKPSDLLLIFMLKAAYPERYRERHETRVVWDETVEAALTRIIQVVERNVADPDALARIRADLAGLTGAGPTT